MKYFNIQYWVGRHIINYYKLIFCSVSTNDIPSNIYIQELFMSQRCMIELLKRKTTPRNCRGIKICQLYKNSEIKLSYLNFSLVLLLYLAVEEKNYNLAKFRKRNKCFSGDVLNKHISQRLIYYIDNKKKWKKNFA